MKDSTRCRTGRGPDEGDGPDGFGTYGSATLNDRQRVSSRRSEALRGPRELLLNPTLAPTQNKKPRPNGRGFSRTISATYARRRRMIIASAPMPISAHVVGSGMMVTRWLNTYPLPLDAKK